MDKIRIGLVGLKPFSGNKGCEALTFSFISLLTKLYGKQKNIELVFILDFPIRSAMKFHLFQEKNKKNLKKLCDYKFKYVYYRVFSNKIYWFNRIGNLSCVFDFTQGDSFTDLYGFERFNRWTLVKEFLINKKYKFVIGSQTIGPFEDNICLERAKNIIRNSYEVFVRDEKSMLYTENLCDRRPILTTDLAFLLDYNKSQKNNKRMKIGFNVSGLLWNEKSYLFSEFDYQIFCRNLIKEFLSLDADVYLIAHVLEKKLSIKDNDLSPILILKSEFPNIKISPFFESCVEAKSFISTMDFFVGSRMHATIAALSSGVAVVPLSYSRKFEGLFGTLEYKYCINGNVVNDKDAISYILNCLKNKNELDLNVKKSMNIIKKFNDIALKEYSRVLAINNDN